MSTRCEGISRDILNCVLPITAVNQGGQFLDLSLISDCFEKKENRHKIDQIWSKHGQSLNSNQRQ